MSYNFINYKFEDNFNNREKDVHISEMLRLLKPLRAQGESYLISLAEKADKIPIISSYEIKDPEFITETGSIIIKLVKDFNVDNLIDKLLKIRTDIGIW